MMMLPLATGRAGPAPLMTFKTCASPLPMQATKSGWPQEHTSQPTDTNREISFNLKSGVSLYGGFDWHGN